MSLVFQDLKCISWDLRSLHTASIQLKQSKEEDSIIEASVKKKTKLSHRAVMASDLKRTSKEAGNIFREAFEMSRQIIFARIMYSYPAHDVPGLWLTLPDRSLQATTDTNNYEFSSFY